MKIKTNHLLLVTLLVLNTLNSFSQQTDQVKTIFELFNMAAEGCSLLDNNQEDVVESIMMGENVSNKKNEVNEKDLDLLMKAYTPLFKRNDKVSSKYEKKAPIVKFENGNQSFKKDGKYGIKNAKGTILIPAEFHTIVQSGENGFVGYENQFCNYYLNDGEKLLRGDYYYIKPTVKNTLIVQTKEGFGVISKNEEVIISPSYYHIKDVFKNEQFYYWVLKSKKIGFYMSENAKDTTFINTTPNEIEFIDSIYWKSYRTIINSKTKRNLFCGKYVVEVVSDKHQLALIRKYSNRLKYLIKFNGDLVNNLPFADIRKFRDNNLAIASIKKERKSFYGLIDKNGEWIIKPIYSRLQFLNDSKLLATDSNKKTGILTIENKTIIAFDYDNVQKINEHYALAVKLDNKLISSDIIDLQNAEIIKSKVPYAIITKAKRCDTEVFIGKRNRTECVLNSDFEKISPADYTRVFYGPNDNLFIGTNFLENNKRQSQVFNCKGKLQTLNIKGKTYDTFYNYEEITPELHHVLLLTGEGYFVSTKGKAIENNTHWQYIEYSNIKDLFITMKYGGKYGIINSLGETIIPPLFKYISTFDSETGLAKYSFDKNRKGYITVDGKLLFGTKYIETGVLDYGNFKVKNNEKWGVVNLNGDEIVPIKYSEIWLNGGLIYVKQGNSVQHFDLLGNFME
ncbi:WG repeat-containing protein [Aureibaculum sp. A20]|uniref:WG repeat-containing protein n=1 Tax=Aureibaculum flavum TaxID=2795986 RepID=A0ABS0WU96_9FLAO|nr:WG repeat-containing protein [Aureibaculum flavum]MBJ2175557.1 WG repeat-containing protein [Aureibaculum flavum]